MGQGAAWRSELEEQGRGVVGALLVVGVPFFYTMESWWLAFSLPLTHLALYTAVGLVVVVLVARQVGFRRDGGESGQGPFELLAEVTGLVLQSSVAAVVVLTVLGVIDAGTEPHVAVRLVLVLLVPLGLGAALANRLFAGADRGGKPEGAFPGNVAVFALGATFLTFPVAPTEEVALIAARMGPLHYLALLGLSLGLVHLTLYELAFRGESARAVDVPRYEVGTSLTAYAVALGVGAFLLWGFGQFAGRTAPVVVAKTLVLSFPAAVGAAGAEVVL